MVTVGADGVGFTFTVIEARGLSHPSEVTWLTYHVVVQVVEVFGVGAKVLADPPVATVYQRRVLPEAAVAVNALAVAFWQ